MKYRMGDTVRVAKPAVLKALSEDEANEQLVDGLIAMANGTIPEFARQDYMDIVLATQEMVDYYNKMYEDETRSHQ